MRITWARNALGLEGLEEQLTAGFLKFRSQDSTSRALKETIKTQSLQRRSSRLGLKSSKSMWLKNQTKHMLSKNAIQPPRNREPGARAGNNDARAGASSKDPAEKPAKMVSTIAEEGEESPGPVSASSVSVETEAEAEAASTPPMDRQSTLGILLGQESEGSLEEESVAAAGAAGQKEGVAAEKKSGKGSDSGNAVAASEVKTAEDGGTAESTVARGDRRSMTRGSSEFTLKNVNYEISAEHRSDRQFEKTKHRRASEGASASKSRARANSARHRGSVSSRSLIYGNSRRLAREDPHTHVADRSVRRMKRLGATKQVSFGAPRPSKEQQQTLNAAHEKSESSPLLLWWYRY